MLRDSISSYLSIPAPNLVVGPRQRLYGNTGGVGVPVSSSASTNLFLALYDTLNIGDAIFIEMITAFINVSAGAVNFTAPAVYMSAQGGPAFPIAELETTVVNANNGFQTFAVHPTLPLMTQWDLLYYANARGSGVGQPWQFAFALKATNLSGTVAATMTLETFVIYRVVKGIAES